MEEGRERWIKHYSSNHQILLVGEGNFSFSLCLAKAFGSAANITATSLDTREELDRKYGSEAKANVEELKALGCRVMHGVDVHTMSRDINLRSRRYDRIVFNFPHAGFNSPYVRETDSFMIERHQWLVRGFLRNAREMAKDDGEIHVTHKTSHPFCKWEIKKLGESESLTLVEEAMFCLWNYPGYDNKKGSGLHCNSSFPVGACSTFMFSKVILFG